MENKLLREVRFLKIYAFVATLLCAGFLLTGFANQKFAEIDVERINIVEKDGKLRMVISNKARQHPGIVNGKLISRENETRQAGMLFFNDFGDEMGGLVYGENGKASHFGSLTFDKFRGDQTMGFRYLQSDNGSIHQGLEMWKQPDITGDILGDKYKAINKMKDEKERAAAWKELAEKGELATSLVFLGKRRDNTTGLSLFDAKGKPRIRLIVNADGTPKLEFLDAEGKVVQTLPENTKTAEVKKP